MKILLFIFILIINLHAELVRVVSKDDNIITSIKLDLYNNFPNKIYFIIYQEYDTEDNIGLINKYFIGYQYKF